MSNRAAAGLRVLAAVGAVVLVVVAVEAARNWAFRSAGARCTNDRCVSIEDELVTIHIELNDIQLQIDGLALTLPYTGDGEFVSRAP